MSHPLRTRTVWLFAVAASFGCAVDETPTPGSGGSQSPGGAGSGASAGTSPSEAGKGGSSGVGGSGATGGGGNASVGGAAGSAGATAAGGSAQAGTGGSAGSRAGGSNGGSTGGMLGGGSGAGGSSAGVGGTGGDPGAGGSGGSGGAMASTGCGKAPPASERYTMEVDGTTREYILDVPSDYDPSQPYRLVFGWHPLGGSADQVARGAYYGLEGEADGSAIFVAPEGLPFQGSNLGWANTGGRDIAFLEAMLARFRAELCIDESRIFSTGFSFGGMMSFAVGCAMNGMMRAIAPMAGNIQVSGCENGSRPVAVMGFHGTEDTVVSIEGGRDGRDVFIERNGCTEQTQPADTDWCDGISNEPCSCVSYQGCTAGYPLTWCEFNGPHTPAPNSAATIWNFFTQF